MEKYEIKCEQCLEVLGTLVKNISNDDKEFYKQTTTCSNGHTEAIILIKIE